MQKNIFFILIGIILSCAGSSNDNSGSDLSGAASDKSTIIVPKFPIEIDVKKDYPQKMVNHEDLAEVSYVQLERTPDNLLNFKGTAFFTREDIFVNDDKYVQRYGRDGKFKNKIGRVGRGPEELVMFTNYMIDTLDREVYMYDNGQNKTVVFDYNGIFQREFIKKDPVYCLQVETLSPKTLIIGRQLRAWGDRPMEPGYLFAEISKEDGSELKKIGPYISQDNKRNMQSQMRVFLRFKDEVIVEHNNSDTIYSFKPAAYPNLVFEPRYILTPPQFCVGDVRYDVEMRFESEKYAFLRYTRLDIKKLPNNGILSKSLMIDKATGEISEAKFTIGGDDYNLVPTSTNLDGIAYSVVQPHNLIEARGAGEIKNPQLRAIAENISENSNPVFIVFNFR